MIDISTKNRLAADFRQHGYNPINIYLYGPDGENDPDMEAVQNMPPRLLETQPYYQLLLKAYPPELMALKPEIQQLVSHPQESSYDKIHYMLCRTKNMDFIRGMMRDVGDTPAEVLHKLGIPFGGVLVSELNAVYQVELAKVKRAEQLRKKLEAPARSVTHKIVEVTTETHEKIRALAKEMGKSNIEVMAMAVQAVYSKLFTVEDERTEEDY